MITGKRYYYEWVKSLGAICELINDPLIGWSLGDIKGFRSADVAPSIVKRVRGILKAAGIMKRPNFSGLPQHVSPLGWKSVEIEWIIRVP